MKTAKSMFSTVGVFCLLLTGVWFLSRLTNILAWPTPISLFAVLLIEISVLAGVHYFRGGKVTTKSILGSVFLVCLGLSLTLGLISAASYLLAHLQGKTIFTSFPWYSVLAFAMIIVGPIILLTGLGWIILHLREQKRNIKDIRLMVQLLLIGTAVWAILWTILRIRHIIVYPNSYGYPWHATFVYTLINFGPGLGMESLAFCILRHFEKKLTPEELAVTVPEVVPGFVRRPIHWSTVFSDGAVIVVPLLVVSLLMAILWDTGYLLLNIGIMVCSTLSVCLVIGLAAWLVFHRIGAERLRDVRLLTVVLTGLTVVATVAWIVWYSQNRLLGASGLPANWVYTLALGFFGPILQGEGIMLVLLNRVERRLFPVVPTEKPGKIWILALAAILVLQCAVFWYQFSNMEYTDELDVSISKVSDPQSDPVDHIIVTVKADHDVRWIRYSDDEIRGDGLFLTCATTWDPLSEIKHGQFSWYLYPEENTKYVYVFEPGIGYQLILVKDPDTGKWEFYK